MAVLCACSRATQTFVRVMILFSVFVATAFASAGDRSYIFTKCLWRCKSSICTNVDRFMQKQPSYMRLLQWSCDDECNYNCMWQTVKAYQDDGSDVPQFYGKWPFVRWIGIQEPASMIFSLFNAMTHLGILVFRAKVRSSTPMYWVWHGMAVVGVSTWLCAAIFHTRDFPLTEMMDYFTAFALVLYNLFSLIARLNISRDSRMLLMAGLLLTSLWLYHVSCLYHHFDYGYNMIVNLAVGALNAIGWLVWCWYQYSRFGHTHTIHAAIVVLGLSLLLTLELLDFPPLFWTLDAHALWHAGTIPLTIWWYRFIIADSLHIESKIDKFKKTV